MEYVKLSSVLHEVCKKTTMNNQYTVLTSSQKGLIEQSLYFNKQVASTNNVGYKIIRKGQYTYRSMSDTGLFFINRLTKLDYGIVSPAYPVFELVSDKIIPEYLDLYFKSELFQFQIKDFSNGSTRLALKFDKLSTLKIFIPTIEKQTKIVNEIKKISRLKEKYDQELESLETIVKSQFIEMFGNPLLNEKHYEIKTYGELFILNAGGTPSKNNKEYWENGTISWIGSNLCQNVVLYENDGKYITDLGYKNSSTKLFPVDTVLIALVGATIGKTALLKFETTTNQNVLGIRGISESGYNPMFVYYYTQFLYHKFLDIGDGGFIMASKEFVSKLPIFNVTIESQNKFALFAQQVDKSKYIKSNTYFLCI